MIVIYTLGAIFGLIIATIIVVFISTRQEKPFDLNEESEDLINNKNKNKYENRNK